MSVSILGQQFCDLCTGQHLPYTQHDAVQSKGWCHHDTHVHDAVYVCHFLNVGLKSQFRQSVTGVLLESFASRTANFQNL